MGKPGRKSSVAKMAKRGFRGNPVATIAFYGPTADFATKVASLKCGKGRLCRAPRFLLGEYASALRKVGARVVIRHHSRRAKPPAPRVVHFGSSYVVADAFEVETLA